MITESERKTLDAVPTCRARGWGVGDELASKSWRSDRKIAAVSGPEVQLVEVRRGGDECRRPWVRNLPGDVTRVREAKHDAA